ncbi:MAG: flagellar filament capping protein FliD [Chloroflexota bacterium]|nr:flagellar filament capping protein FliD [Chloroflexota bacterium]
MSIDPSVLNTLNNVIATDPLLIGNIQQTDLGIPALSARAQLNQERQLPSTQQVVVSGLYSQAAALTSVFTTLQTAAEAAAAPASSTATDLASSVGNYVTAFNNLQSYLAGNASLLNPNIEQQIEKVLQSNLAPLGALGISASSGQLSVNPSTLATTISTDAASVQSALVGTSGFATQVNGLAASFTSVAQNQLLTPLAAANPQASQSLASLLFSSLVGGALVNVQV